MKKNSLIAIWINRVLITLFIGSLLFVIFDSEYLVYSFLIAFPLGVFQLFSFLFSIIRYKKLASLARKYVVIYSLIFVAYLLFTFIYLVYLKSFYFVVLEYGMQFIPVLLSLFWTFILETSKYD